MSSAYDPDDAPFAERFRRLFDLSLLLGILLAAAYLIFATGFDDHILVSTCVMALSGLISFFAPPRDERDGDTLEIDVPPPPSRVSRLFWLAASLAPLGYLIVARQVPGYSEPAWFAYAPWAAIVIIGIVLILQPAPDEGLNWHRMTGGAILAITAIAGFAAYSLTAAA